MKLNKNKSIGNVIYIVEGDKDEVDILTNIYSKILDYSLYCYDKRKDFVKLVSNTNKYSKVFILPAHYSAISKLDINDDYFNNAYRMLSEYGLDVENSSIYFLFDRDRESNRPGRILENFNKYRNSRDNLMEMNGLFLLSYPSIEAYYYNCNNIEVLLYNGHEAKLGLNDINKIIDENLLLQGANYLINSFKNLKLDFLLDDLDDFSSINKQVFDYEEKHYSNCHNYKVLSLIFISLLDLGIIEDIF